MAPIKPQDPLASNNGKGGNKETTSKVNFSIGDTHNPQFYKETSTGVAFENNNLPQSGRIVVDVPNLRQANFQVGNEKLDYTTTTQAIQSSMKRLDTAQVSASQLK